MWGVLPSYNNKYKHGVSFHLFRYSLIVFQHCSTASSVGLALLLLNFHFFLSILFFKSYCIWNGLEMLFVDCSLAVYRNTTDFAYCFCKLQPCELVSSNMDSQGLHCMILPSVTRSSVTSSFLIWMTFVYFSWLILLSRTSTTMLNNSGKQTSLPCL